MDKKFHIYIYINRQSVAESLYISKTLPDLKIRFYL